MVIKSLLSSQKDGREESLPINVRCWEELRNVQNYYPKRNGVCILKTVQIIKSTSKIFRAFDSVISLMRADSKAVSFQRRRKQEAQRGSLQNRTVGDNLNMGEW